MLMHRCLHGTFHPEKGVRHERTRSRPQSNVTLDRREGVRFRTCRYAWSTDHSLADRCRGKQLSQQDRLMGHSRCFDPCKLRGTGTGLAGSPMVPWIRAKPHHLSWLCLCLAYGPVDRVQLGVSGRILQCMRPRFLIFYYNSRQSLGSSFFARKQIKIFLPINVFDDFRAVINFL